MKRRMGLGEALIAGVLSAAVSGCGCGDRSIEVPVRDFEPDVSQVAPRPLTLGAGEDSVLCDGASVVLGTPALPGYTYRWTPADGLSDPNAAQPTASPKEPITYTLTATDDETGLTGTDTVDVIVNRLPRAVITAPGGTVPITAICAGNDWELSGERSAAEDGAEIVLYAWTFGSESSTEPSPRFSILNAGLGEARLEVTDSLGCSAASTVRISSFPYAITNAGADLLVPRGYGDRIGASTQNTGSFSWSCNRADCALSNPTVLQPVASPLRSTRYTLIGNNGPGCDDSSDVTVWVAMGLETSPTDGAEEYPVTADLRVHFDETIDEASLNDSNVVLENALTGEQIPTTISYDAATRSLIVTPPTPETNGYVRDGSYRLILQGGLSGIVSDDPILPSLMPRTMVIDYTTSKRDSRPPKLEFFYPTLPGRIASTTTKIIAVFDEALDPATVNTTNFQVFRGSTLVPGQVAYDGPNHTILFTPRGGLDRHHHYRVAIRDVQDLSGNPSNGHWSFLTGPDADQIQPSVLSSAPSDGASAVSTRTSVSIQLDEQIDVTTLDRIRLVRDSDGFRVWGKVKYDPHTMTLTFEPTKLLDSESAYTLHTVGVKDLSGNSLPTTYSTFGTRLRLFVDDFEQGNASWQAPVLLNTPSWGLSSLGYGSEGSCLVDSVGSNYADNTNTSVTGATVDVSGKANISVEFALATVLEAHHDILYAEYRFDGGAWEPLPGFRAGFSGVSSWTRWDSVVANPGASEFQLRFRLISDGVRNFDGVRIDDVLIQSY